MLISIVVIAISALLPADGRLVVWAAFTIGWLVLMLVFGRNSRRGSVTGIVPTDSMVERFDLLIIIVLGEVVTGVVNGMAGIEHDPLGLATGLRRARWSDSACGGSSSTSAGAARRVSTGWRSTLWMEAHLPIAIAIVGAGAAMVGLIGGAHEPQTPAPVAWLLAGSVALLLVALAGMTRTLADFERHAVVYRPLAGVMLGAAGVALLVGWWRPAPWLLALLLAAILASVWLFAVVRLFKTGTWTAAGPPGDDRRAARCRDAAASSARR